MVSHPLCVLALRRRAGLAVEDAALPLAAGCLASQKLEGIFALGLHTQCCLAARIIVILIEDQPCGEGVAWDSITASGRGPEPGGQVLLNLRLNLLHPLAAGWGVEAAALRAALRVVAHTLAKLPLLGLGRSKEDADVGATALRDEDLGGGRLEHWLGPSQHLLSLSITVLLGGWSRGDGPERLGAPPNPKSSFCAEATAPRMRRASMVVLL